MGTIVLDNIFVVVQFLLIIFGQTRMPNWTRIINRREFSQVLATNCCAIVISNTCNGMKLLNMSFETKHSVKRPSALPLCTADGVCQLPNSFVAP